MAGGSCSAGLGLQQDSIPPCSPHSCKHKSADANDFPAGSRVAAEDGLEEKYSKKPWQLCRNRAQAAAGLSYTPAPAQVCFGAAPSIRLSVCSPVPSVTVHLSACLPAYLSVGLSACLPAHLPVFLSACLSPCSVPCLSACCPSVRMCSSCQGTAGSPLLLPPPLQARWSFQVPAAFSLFLCCQFDSLGLQQPANGFGYKQPDSSTEVFLHTLSQRHEFPHLPLAICRTESDVSLREVVGVPKAALGPASTGRTTSAARFAFSISSTLKRLKKKQLPPPPPPLLHPPPSLRAGGRSGREEERGESELTFTRWKRLVLRCL